MFPINLAKIYTLALAGLVVLGMAGSLALTLRPGRVKSDTENRQLAALPAFPANPGEMQEFPARFESFFNDHFGLRKFLLRVNTRIFSKILGQFASDRVIQGYDGWLFYADEHALELYENRLPFQPPILDRWREALQHRVAWLKARQIAYVFFVTPDKSTIYSELMPKFLRKMSRFSQLDQLTDLARNNNLPVVDARAQLLLAKQQSPQYLRDDTHWNEAGAYVGYQVVMDFLKNFRPVPLYLLGPEAFENRERRPGDLATMAQIKRRELAPELNRARLPCQISPALGVEWSEPIQRITCKAGTGKLLLFMDSFSVALLPYLAQNFAEIVAVWKMPSLPAIQALVEEENPDVVVEQRVERNLNRPIE